MSLCVAAAGKLFVLATSTFTLAWQHSVEHVEWQERWTVSAIGLQIVEARVKGSGSGMDPPEGSVLEDGWWVYRPTLEPLPELVLAASGATASGWRLCTEDGCRELGAIAGAPLRLWPCG